MPDTPAGPERTSRAPDHARPRLERDQRRTLSTTTRTCNTVATGQLVDRQGDLMVLDRGVLTKIDGKVFDELRHDAGIQAVKIPLSDAGWST
jgi:hypothetical protein